jgi:hypothetical protein
MVFLGNGEDSAKAQRKVMRRVRGGFNLMCGLQQGVDMTSPEGKAGNEELKDVVRDLAAAFGFQITVRKKPLPY